MSAASRRPESDPTGIGSDAEAQPLPMAGPGSGSPRDLGDGQAFRLHGRLYVIDPGARLTLEQWHKRMPLAMGEIDQLVRLLDSFIDYHLTRHGREMWRTDRRAGGPITLHDLWEVTYLIDPSSRPAIENRDMRRGKRRGRQR